MRYVDIIIDCIVREYGRMRARTLINKYDLTCLHVKKGGRDSGQGIYAHHDIALRFAEWLNPAYGVFVNKDYQRLKNREIDELTNRGATWKFDRRDTALWHRLLEVAVRSNIVPKALDIPIEDLVTIPDDQLQSMANEIIAGTMIYVSNLINVAVFGKTAKQWRDENPELTGNIRDYATEDELNLVNYLEYQMIQIVAEEPQSHWRKLINRISKKCRDVGIATMLNMSTNTGIITTNDPVSYDARTITAHESAKEAFKNELLTGKIHYDKNDDVFRDIDGFIRLGWKI